MYLLPVLDDGQGVEGVQSKLWNPRSTSSNDVVNVEKNLCFGRIVFVVDLDLTDVVKELRLRCIF